jgi:hypothetical protein
MNGKYFKLRKNWKIRKHRFDIGPLFNMNPIHISGYFVMGIFNITEQEYLPFYQFHLNHYLVNNPDGKEETFLATVLEIIDKDRQSRETLYYYNTRSKTRIYKLSKFRETLKAIDQWGLTLTNEERLRQSISYVQEIMNWQNTNDTKSVLSKLLFDEVGSEKFFIEYKRIIDERDLLETELADKTAELNKQKKKYKAVAPTTKIQIVSGDHKPLLDLFLQMKDLENPSTERGYLHGSPDTWSSLLSNYFEYGDNNIPSDNNREINRNSVRDYFLEKSGSSMLKPHNRDKYFHIRESKRYNR